MNSFAPRCSLRRRAGTMLAQRLLHAAPLLCLVVGAVVVTSAYADPLGPSFTVPLPPPPIGAPEHPVDRPHAQPESMASWLSEFQVFGSPGTRQPVAETVEVPPEEPEPRPPAIALVGTAAGDTPESSLATIRTPDGTELVQVGDALLEDSVTVVAIAPKAMLVRFEGRLYRVRLGAELPEYRPSRGPVSQSALTGVRLVGPHQYEIDVQQFERHTKDFEGGEPDVQPVPYEDGERIQFQTVAPDSPFALVGLRSGDIIMEVNGVDAADFEAMGEAMEQVETTKRLTMTVERGGRLVTMSYRFFNTP